MIYILKNVFCVIFRYLDVSEKYVLEIKVNQKKRFMSKSTENKHYNFEFIYYIIILIL